MKIRDFLLLVFVCLVWGYSNVLSKIVVGNWAVPPLFFAAVRFAVVIAATLPWLLPMPRPRWRIVIIGLLMGAGNFALLFVGLQTASPSAAAVVIQIGVPFTTLLSVVMLGERIHWRRGLGIALTLAGVVLVVWNPEGLDLSAGLWFVVAAAFTGSLGAVLMKQVEDVSPLRFQAWVGLVSFVPLTLASALFETGQWASAAAVGWPFVAAVLFAALVVSVLGHTSYYGLIRKYEANLLAPLTLMTPLFTIAFGVALTGDRVDARMAAGALLALAGVLVVALRSRPKSALLAEREQA
ncbi:DMT family transporter [Sphingomonas jeddahensis]|uniref:Putative amino-acid metabolite efflux pump n=1 Tax=Sphingomonas jeddahensis TaxID=1915074 RepID=A0A1V2EUK6_9SPHN|nr:EamA family transporter [Sphingomonas jeddahensis]ONF95834.1 putative amino-acid metabolite efflux pump [Sphingomonas jeddahensis]